MPSGLAVASETTTASDSAAEKAFTDEAPAAEPNVQQQIATVGETAEAGISAATDEDGGRPAESEAAAAGPDVCCTDTAADAVKPAAGGALGELTAAAGESAAAGGPAVGDPAAGVAGTEAAAATGAAAPISRRNFRKVQLVGQGNVGNVFLVHSEGLGRHDGLFAMKVLNKRDMIERGEPAGSRKQAPAIRLFTY